MTFGARTAPRGSLSWYSRQQVQMSSGPVRIGRDAAKRRPSSDNGLVQHGLARRRQLFEERIVGLPLPEPERHQRLMKRDSMLLLAEVGRETWRRGHLHQIDEDRVEWVRHDARVVEDG